MNFSKTSWAHEVPASWDAGFMMPHGLSDRDSLIPLGEKEKGLAISKASI
jgi:hypothetical protein